MYKIRSAKFWTGIEKARRIRHIVIYAFFGVTVILGIIALIFFLTEDDPAALNKPYEMEPGKFIYIDVTWIQTYIDEGNARDFHFVGDSNWFLYLTQITGSTSRKLLEATPENPVRLTGKIMELSGLDRSSGVPNMMIHWKEGDPPITPGQAAAMYNYYKHSDEPRLTIDDISDFFISEKNQYTNMWIFIGIAVPVLCFALAFLIAHFVIERKIERTLANLSPEEADMITKEIENDNTIVFEKAHVFLTDNYIISMDRSLYFTKYSDIAWVYHTTITQNGVKSNIRVEIITHDKKNHYITIIPYGKTKDTHLEIISVIAEKDPNILIGYTNENIAIMKNK